MASKEETLSQLQAMFPAWSRDGLATLLDACGGDVQRCTDQIISSPADATGAAPPATSSRPAPRPVDAPVPAPAAAESFDDVVERVARLANDTPILRMAELYGLAIQSCSWEDTARNKRSVWGPCVSDLTLAAEGRALPVIRTPNYADTTFDVPLERIPLNVGNQVGAPLAHVTLRDYLADFRSFLGAPDEWPGGGKSLLADRDTHVVMSAQSCMLPIAKDGDSRFSIKLWNYQSRPREPAVLVILASQQGTSAQIVERAADWTGQDLFFNQAGRNAHFVASRLRDDRRRRGVAEEGAMTAAERSQNMVMVIQVPLKHRPRGPRRKKFDPYRFDPPSYDDDDDDDDEGSGDDNDDLLPVMPPHPHPHPHPHPPFPRPPRDDYPPVMPMAMGAAAAPSSASSAMCDEGAVLEQASSSSAHRRAAMPPGGGGGGRALAKRAEDTDHAVVRVAAADGPFRECGGVAIERDPRYPIRVTLQFYRATSSGVVGADTLQEIAAQLQEAQKYASSVGSLVTDGRTGRVTEPDLPPSHPGGGGGGGRPIGAPDPHAAESWWPDFWAANGRQFSHLSEQTAREMAFPRFRGVSLEVAAPALVDLFQAPPVFDPMSC